MPAMRVSAGLRVGLDAEGRVLLGQALQRDGRACPGRPSSWARCLTSMTGSGKVIDSRIDGVVGVGQGVAGEGVLEADRGGDVAGVDLLDLLAVVGVHLEDAADALLACPWSALRTYEPALSVPGVDPEEGQLADERVGGDLEGERREGLVVVDRAQRPRRRCRGSMADDRRHVERRGQVVDDRVEHRLDALVLERRAGQDRDDLVLQRAQAQAVLDLLGGELLALEVLVGQRRRPSRRRPRSCASRCFSASAMQLVGDLALDRSGCPGRRRR